MECSSLNHFTLILRNQTKVLFVRGHHLPLPLLLQGQLLLVSLVLLVLPVGKHSGLPA